MKHPSATTPLASASPAPEFRHAASIGNLHLLSGAVCAALIFCWLATIVRSGQILVIDTPNILQAFHGHRWILEELAQIICASVTVVSVSILAMLIYRRMMLPAFFWLCAVGGGALLESFIKKLIQRPRPVFSDHLIHQSSFAFPSGHAIHSAAIVLAALLLLGGDARRRKMLCLFGGVFVALVGFSRLYLGAHYPSDILAGWALAGTWVFALGAVFDLPATTALRNAHKL
jgi:undecaprenyl-diphosphatase